MASSGARDECRLERDFRLAVEAAGGACVKLDPRSRRGIPDRLVLLPNFIGLAELKKDPKAKVSKLQIRWGERLEAMGLPYIRSYDLDELLAWCGLG